MSAPHVYTNPAWAVREARRQALEEAAALCDRYGANLGPSHQAAVFNLAAMIRQVGTKDDAEILMAQPDVPVLERAVRAGQRVTVFSTSEHSEIRVVMLAPEEALALVKAGREALIVEAEVKKAMAKLKAG